MRLQASSVSPSSSSSSTSAHVPADGHSAEAEVSNGSLEQSRAQVEIIVFARTASVDDGRGDGPVASVDGDLLATDPVVVGVAIDSGRVVALGVDGNHVLVVAVHRPTGSVTREVEPGSFTVQTLLELDSSAGDSGSRGDESNDRGSELHVDDDMNGEVGVNREAGWKC